MTPLENPQWYNYICIAVNSDPLNFGRRTHLLCIHQEQVARETFGGKGLSPER